MDAASWPGGIRSDGFPCGREGSSVKHISFGESLRALPRPFRKFLIAVALFGSGDFAHSMLILLATQRLTPILGANKAASVAVGLYLLHNVLYAGFAFVAGWLADRFEKRGLLALGYAFAAAMVLLIIALPVSILTLAFVFALGGIHVAMSETLEDSFCAELVEEEHHGMAFGVLASVNGVGDFLSSTVVGLLWTAVSANVAFAYSGILFVLGSCLVTLLPRQHRPS
jgi:MFS family permease